MRHESKEFHVTVFGSDQGCAHTPARPDFDPEAAKTLSAAEVRKYYPRFRGVCPDCGANLILYASKEHYVMGDW